MGMRSRDGAARRRATTFALALAISLLASQSPARGDDDGAEPGASFDYAAKERLLFGDPANRDLVASALLKDDSSEARRIIDRGLLPGGSEDVILAIVKAIAYRRDGDHVPALLLLHGTDTRERVRAAARDALEPLVTPALERRLYDLLRDPMQPLAVQKSAVQFLGQAFDREVVEGLVDLLGETGTLFDTSPGRNLIADALARLTPADFGADASEWRRWWAAERSRSDADILLAALHQERERSAFHRREAIAARKSLLDGLRGRKGEEAAFLGEIVAVLRQSPYPELQQHALLRLKELNQWLEGRADAPADVRFGPAIDLVIALLAEPRLDRGVQITAIDVLATLAEPDASSGDEAAATADRAARAISSFVPVGQPEDVTLAAVKALGRIRSAFAAAPLLLRLDGDAAPEPNGSAGSGAPAAANGLREEIVLALGEIGAPSASAALVRVLQSRESEPAGVRGCAASALGRIGASSAVAALADALARDPDSKVRWRAADSLARIGGEAVESPLIAGLEDPAKEVRKQCATGLAALRIRAAVPALTRLLGDPDDVVREAAVVALGSIADPQAVRAILALIEDPVDKVALAAQTSFVAALGGDAKLLLAETRALAGEKKEKLALDILRLARESIEGSRAGGGPWRPEAIREIDRAYLDALVASGTDENRQAAIRLAGQLAEEAGATESAARFEFRKRQGDLFLEAKDYENAVEAYTRLLDTASATGDESYEIFCRLGRAYLELGRANGDALSVANAGRHLTVEFPERVSAAVREERAALVQEIRETFVAEVNGLFEDGIGPSASLSPRWQKFEELTSKWPFIEALLESARESKDSAYLKAVAKAFRAVAPDAPPLGESPAAAAADRERDIEALRKFWLRRLPPAPSPDRR